MIVTTATMYGVMHVHGRRPRHREFTRLAHGGPSAADPARSGGPKESPPLAGFSIRRALIARRPEGRAPAPARGSSSRERSPAPSASRSHRGRMETLRRHVVGKDDLVPLEREVDIGQLPHRSGPPAPSGRRSGRRPATKHLGGGKDRLGPRPRQQHPVIGRHQQPPRRAQARPARRAAARTGRKLRHRMEPPAPEMRPPSRSTAPARSRCPSSARGRPSPISSTGPAVPAPCGSWLPGVKQITDFRRRGPVIAARAQRRVHDPEVRLPPPGAESPMNMHKGLRRGPRGDHRDRPARPAVR